MLTELKSRIPIIALIIANLLPLAGVLWWQWDAGYLLLMYWAENLVIGFYTIAKMLSVSFSKPRLIFGALFNIVFFSIHYGGFVGMHGLFLLEFIQFGEGGIKASMGQHSWPGPLVFLEILTNVVQYIFSFMTIGMLFALLALFISHGVSFIANFILRGEYKNARPNKLMMSPYGRIFILHVVVIAGGILVVKSGSATSMLILLIAIKVAVDIVLHIRSHRKDLPDE